MIGRTLAPIYGFGASYAYALYNDDPPDGGQNNKFAYSNGVIAMNRNSGIFLTHTVPKFPPRREKGYKDKSAKFNDEGDIFLCMSFRPRDAGSQLSKQIALLKPNVYEFHNIKEVEETVPEFESIRPGKERGTLPADGGIEDINLAKGTIFKSYVRPIDKENNLGDFYYDFLGRHLNESLIVKTKKLDTKSKCTTGRHVYNARKVELKLNQTETPLYPVVGPWNIGADRSRFVVTDTELGGSFCITDHNREGDHTKRGGSAWCLKHNQVWQLLKTSLTDLEPCEGVKSIET